MVYACESIHERIPRMAIAAVGWYGMRMKRRRIQITLDEEQYDRLHRWAQERGLTISQGIHTILSELPVERAERQAATARILAAEPMPIPKYPADLRRELDAAHERASR